MYARSVVASDQLNDVMCLSIMAQQVDQSAFSMSVPTSSSVGRFRQYVIAIVSMYVRGPQGDVIEAEVMSAIGDADPGLPTRALQRRWLTWDKQDLDAGVEPPLVGNVYLASMVSGKFRKFDDDPDFNSMGELIAWTKLGSIESLRQSCLHALASFAEDNDMMAS